MSASPLRGASAALILLLPLWSAAAAASTPASPGWQHSPSTTASWLQQAGAQSWSPPAQAPPPGPPPLDVSTIPQQPFSVCSAIADFTGGFPSCSSFDQTGRCSAQCNAGTTCSILGVDPPGVGECSAIGAGSRCSVLQPTTVPIAGPSTCSVQSGVPAFTGERCSVFDGGRKAACSAQNPGSLDPTSDRCSVDAPSGPECSVLNLGSSVAGYCSAGLVGDKFCSTFNGASSCSIVQGGRGVCTVLKHAPANTCSAFDMGNCSVIGGPSGTGICRQP